MWATLASCVVGHVVGVAKVEARGWSLAFGAAQRRLKPAATGCGWVADQGRGSNGSRMVVPDSGFPRADRRLARQLQQGLIPEHGFAEKVRHGLEGEGFAQSSSAAAGPQSKALRYGGREHS